MSGFADALQEELSYLETMLSDKNRRYGNSALNPIRIFAKDVSWQQGLAVRMDDKISRLQSAQGDDLEDAKMDLLGYLLLERVGLRMKAAEGELLRRFPPDPEVVAGMEVVVDD